MVEQALGPTGLTNVSASQVEVGTYREHGPVRVGNALVVETLQRLQVSLAAIEADHCAMRIARVTTRRYRLPRVTTVSVAIGERRLPGPRARRAAPGWATVSPTRRPRTTAGTAEARRGAPTGRRTTPRWRMPLRMPSVGTRSLLVSVPPSRCRRGRGSAAPRLRHHSSADREVRQQTPDGKEVRDTRELFASREVRNGQKNRRDGPRSKSR